MDRIESENRLTITLFSSGLVIVFLLFYLFLRLGFPVSYDSALRTAGLGLFFINIPMIFFKNLHPDSLKTLAAILLAAFVGWIGDRTTVHPSPSWLFALAGWIFFILNSGRLYKTTPRKGLAGLLMMVLLFSIWVVSWLWKSGYQNPLFVEGLTLGRGHIDTLFHSSIAQMIKTYGIPTTGVDGLPPMRYHFGSHWLFAQLASLLDLPLLDFYNFGYGILFIPLYFYALLSAVCEFARLNKTIFPISLNSRTGRIFWFLFLLCHIHFLPESFLSKIAMWNHYLISESYCVAVTFLFLGIPILLRGFRILQKPSGLHGLRVAFLMFLPVFGLALGLFKNSVLVLFTAVVIYIFLRTKTWKDWAATISAAALICFSAWIIKMTSSPNVHYSSIVWFNFLRSLVAPHHLPFFIIFYFFFSWMVFIIRLHQLRVRSFKDFLNRFRFLKILDLEILALACVAGILPGILFFIPGGSAQYFSNIQTRLSVFFLLASVPQWRALNGIWNKRLPILLLVSCFSMVWMGFTVSAAKRMIGLNLRYRMEMADSPKAPAQVFREALSEKNPFLYLKTHLMDEPARSLRGNANDAFLKFLRSYEKEPRAMKSHSLIYIPQADTLFWRKFYRQAPAQAVSLIVPAVSGIAMLDGMPPADVRTEYYGFGYFQRRRQTPAGPDNIQKPCQRAQDMNLKNFRIIEFRSILEPPETFFCKTHPAGEKRTEKKEEDRKE